MIVVYVSPTTKTISLDGFILHSPFATTLWNFLRGQCSYKDSAVLFVCDLQIYIAFTSSTGWVVPINIHDVENKHRPPSLRASFAGASWAHETDWDALRLRCQGLAAQLRIFLYILREVFKRMGVAWEVSRKRILNFLSSNLPVQSLDFRPAVTCDGSSIKKLLSMQQGGTFSACMWRAYSPSCGPLPSLRWSLCSRSMTAGGATRHWFGPDDVAGCCS